METLAKQHALVRLLQVISHNLRTDGVSGPLLDDVNTCLQLSDEVLADLVVEKQAKMDEKADEKESDIVPIFDAPLEVQ